MDFSVGYSEGESPCNPKWYSGLNSLKKEPKSIALIGGNTDKSSKLRPYFSAA